MTQVTLSLFKKSCTVLFCLRNSLQLDSTTLFVESSSTLRLLCVDCTEQNDYVKLKGLLA